MFLGFGLTDNLMVNDGAGTWACFGRSPGPCHRRPAARSREEERGHRAPRNQVQSLHGVPLTAGFPWPRSPDRRELESSPTARCLCHYLGAVATPLASALALGATPGAAGLLPLRGRSRTLLPGQTAPSSCSATAHSPSLSLCEHRGHFNGGTAEVTRGDLWVTPGAGEACQCFI